MEETVFLEQKLRDAFISLHIFRYQRSSLGMYLNLVKLKDEATYCHCIRVALYGVRVAGIMSLDPKALLYAGLLHDVGKAAIDPDLLTKKNFTKADYEKIKSHVLYGYYLLRGVHNFSAEIVLRHHRYDSDGYHKILPYPKTRYSKDTKKLIDRYSKILAIIDFYDAATTRDNERSKGKDVRILLIQHFPNEAEMINLCYEKGIFCPV